MTMRDTDRALVQAATAVAKLRCRSERHTVAAAARTATGRVFTGVNVQHGAVEVCAEVIAVGAAATQGAGELETIVVVRDRGRQVVTPCERCRGLLVAHHPAIRIVIGPMDALGALPLADLPPRDPT